MKTFDKTRPRREVWQELIQQHPASGLSVRVFCQRHGVTEQSFYYWRKQMAATRPMSFALVETDGSMPSRSAGLELLLAGGARLQIAPGVDAGTLRTVLAVLREST